jgi:hypothetical protein
MLQVKDGACICRSKCAFNKWCSSGVKKILQFLQPNVLEVPVDERASGLSTGVEVTGLSKVVVIGGERSVVGKARDDGASA